MDITPEDPKSSQQPKASYEYDDDEQQQQYQQQMLQQQQQQTHLRHLQQQVQRFHAEAAALGEESSSMARKRKLYAIEEQHEESEKSSSQHALLAEHAAPDAAYDADVDEDVAPHVGADIACVGGMAAERPLSKLQKLQSEREHIYELFQPWALKTYGDQAKTKTITMRKKARILKALEGKEHSRPDSSKFRFWVKTKAFTTKRPEGFEEAPGSQRRFQPLPPNAVLSDTPSEVDLFVGSTNKDFGKRTFRKVAVVEEFFDIIYNVHMELGGRSGMHAGQKRTYRIITETYAFLPREAVTRFLSTCPECKKNLRPSSPATSSHNDEPPQNESSSELEVLNYSSHTESSLEAGPTTKSAGGMAIAKKRRNSYTESSLKATSSAQQLEVLPKRRDSSPTQGQHLGVVLPKQILPQQLQPLPQTQFLQQSQSPFHSQSPQQLTTSVPKIRINPQLQRPITSPPPTSALILEREALPAPPPAMPAYAYHPLCFDMNALNNSGGAANESLFHYYEFMRRFYASGGGAGFGAGVAAGFLPLAAQPPPSLAPPLYGSDVMQSLRFPAARSLASTPANAPATPLVPLETADKASKAVIELSDEDGEVKHEQVVKKKFKSSVESFKVHSPAITHDNRPPAPQQQTDVADLSQTSAINLSKPFSNFRSNGTPPPATPTHSLPPKPEPTTPISPPTAATSTPLTVKCEASTPPRASFAALRIPQLRPVAAALPPLDLERLKPITSTYLQLTRSMGMSDEDALRFDNLPHEYKAAA